MITAYRDTQARDRFLTATFGRAGRVVVVLAAAVTITCSILSVYYSAHGNRQTVIIQHPQVGK